MIKKIFAVSIFLIFLLLLYKGTGLFSKTEDFRVCRDCNVILIAVDTLRADHLSLYGYPKNTSPNLDEFAKGARVYQNFYSNAPWTLPSFATMFTSDYPQNLRMQIPSDVLLDKFTTIAEVLSRNGYKTVGFNSANFVSKPRGFSSGFDSFNSFETDNKLQDIDLIIPEATGWLRGNEKEKFFMFLQTFQIHSPYCPPEAFDQFKGDYSGDLNCIDSKTIEKNNDGENVLGKEDLERFKSLYDGEILFTDYYLGKFFDTLWESGLDKKTIVIILGDHGEEFGERGFWGIHSYSLYKELLNVPLIIKAPFLTAGREEKTASIVDIAPTILDFVGIKKPAAFRGKPIRKISDSDIVYSETRSNIKSIIEDKDSPDFLSDGLQIKPRENFLPPFKEGIISNGWKIIFDYNHVRVELYNLESDPFEKNNLAEKNTEKEREMEDLMTKFKEENTGKKATLEEDIKSMFESLF